MDPLLAAALIIAIAALAFGVWSHFAKPRRTPDEGSSSEVRQRLETACRESLAVVDLLAHDDSKPVDLTPTTASSIGERLRLVSEQLSGVDVSSLSASVEDAVDDLRHVSISLSAALDADRSLRFGSTETDSGDQAISSNRVAARSTELDLAARSLITLTGTRG